MNRPKRCYTEFITPIQHLRNFTKELGGPNVYVKRDDQLGLTAGGNKTRKLEYLMADAIENGADTIITCGATQSNHCRLTLAAAVKEGLKCLLVLEEVIPDSYHREANGNILLYHLMGAEMIVVPKGTDMQLEMEKASETVRERGDRPYLIPVGGSNVIGALGYADCAREIIEQTRQLEIELDAIVVATGSAGTHAGLIAGLLQEDSQVPVLGISVSRTRNEAEKLVYDLAAATLNHLESPIELSAEVIHCHDEYVGTGYAQPTDAAMNCIRLLARTEGLLLDPVYTGKVMSGLVDLSKKGRFGKGENILFLHTGGLPSVFGSGAILLQE